MSIIDCTSEDVLCCRESEETYNLLHISLFMDSKCWLITDLEFSKFHYDNTFINLQFWPLSKYIVFPAGVESCIIFSNLNDLNVQRISTSFLDQVTCSPTVTMMVVGLSLVMPTVQLSFFPC